ncbi:sensor histidine kinase [Brachybacterium sacelli]|uniref:histidine kinase n=1 Tax=Brachybacterium sacelli TaxID=173364 RepID=A0ABS4X732_9MICO|nr:ATP-binding protein [Brachybacterium sacelli]MBP2384261.1 signal transduction histidine kinase [Brachybacterium sacelli]
MDGRHATGTGREALDPDLTPTPFASALRWAVHALVYAMVVVAAVIVLLPRPADGAALTLVLLAAVTTVYSVGARRALRRRAGPEGSWGALAHLGPSVVLWSGTFFLGPDAVWVAFGLDFAVLYAMPWTGGLLGLVVVTAIAVLGYTSWSQDPAPGEIAGPVIGALVALAVVITVRALQREVDRRTHLAQQLARARDMIAEQTRAATTAAERDRVARELHDTVAQSNLSIHLLLDAATAALEREETVEARSLVQEARAAAARTGQQTRRFVDAADVDVPTGPELREQLRRLTADATAVGPGAVELRDDLTDQELEELPRSTARALLRLVESLLANAVQHSDAPRIIVTVSRHEHQILLDVVDDGRGFVPEQVAGFGLRSARARAASVGGALVIETAPGAGTAVQVVLPLAQEPLPRPEESP